MKVEAPTPIRLIGNPEENFYILGKKHYALFRRLQKVVNPQSDTWSGRIKSMAQFLTTKKTEFVAQTPADEWLKSYCEGLEVPLATYLQFLEAVEAGALPGALIGCTSVFRWDQTHQRVEHLRLLDWPWAMAPEATQEVLLFQAPDYQTLTMVCVPGLPFLPLSIMNEAGVTLALHAKYHSLQHNDGQLVGRIAIEAMLEAKSVNELKRHLKHLQTKRLWGFHACDPSGQVLTLDIMGPQLDGQSYRIQDEGLLVFNNAPLVKEQEDQQIAEPPAFGDFCRERRRWCLEKLKSFNDESSLIALARAQKTAKFRAPAVTMATIQALAFHPSARRLELLLGTPPLWSQGQLVAWNDLFATSMRQMETITTQPTKDEQQDWSVRHEFALAQKAMDQRDISLAFHHIQMGLVNASGELKHQASWIWVWWQWQFLDGKRDRLHLPQLVKDTLKELPEAHRWHLKFLLLLLEIELDLAPTISPADLPRAFKDWADAYLKAPLFLRLQMEKTLEARLDIQDCAPLRAPIWTKGRLSG